jgi:two-component system, chemotaxis family, CheB/CheR fusion protein
MIEAHESAYEALQMANEEVVSTNEEFQTLNEELETSKEEIEATNEELLSTNQELMMRNDLLTESYKYSEAIIATVHEPMLVLDSNLHVKSANNSFYKKFLVNKEETVGTSVFELGNGQWNIPNLRKLLHEIISKNIAFKNLEITHTFPGLGEKIMQLNAHQIIQKTHKEQLILLAIEDITERARHFLREKADLKRDILEHKAEKLKLEKAVKRRTAQLQQKNQELETANKDLTSFTYVSSHDLQEPLRKIRNFVVVLLDEEKNHLSQDGKRYLKRTYETAKRMQALIEDLLTYSRAKNSERKFEKINLNEIVSEVRKDLEEMIKDKKAIINTNNLCDVKVIPLQFVQLFQNLIVNSIKYSKPEEPPVITINSVITPGSKINDLKLSPENNYCHISFSDNGIGFDRQYRERIFEVFQRLHTKEEYVGTGMGLAICKRIVENHNGVITADGTLNKGARFDIYIPVEEEMVSESLDENRNTGS